MAGFTERHGAVRYVGEYQRVAGSIGCERAQADGEVQYEAELRQGIASEAENELCEGARFEKVHSKAANPQLGHSLLSGPGHNWHRVHIGDFVLLEYAHG